MCIAAKFALCVEVGADELRELVALRTIGRNDDGLLGGASVVTDDRCEAGLLLYSWKEMVRCLEASGEGAWLCLAVKSRATVLVTSVASLWPRAPHGSCISAHLPTRERLQHRLAGCL